ncbi:AfsR/SARP family transcriptional regulator [Actinomadura gamaensis]|uniref:Winged helix-turn-helix domain-containing protein n=1 Tax=Actinomadura gamaensis TaxID=1763541 RepID=A0ABV9U8Q6_9ACTN
MGEALLVGGTAHAAITIRAGCGQLKGAAAQMFHQDTLCHDLGIKIAHSLSSGRSPQSGRELPKPGRGGASRPAAAETHAARATARSLRTVVRDGRDQITQAVRQEAPSLPWTEDGALPGLPRGFQGSVNQRSVGKAALGAPAPEGAGNAPSTRAVPPAATSARDKTGPTAPSAHKDETGPVDAITAGFASTLPDAGLVGVSSMAGLLLAWGLTRPMAFAAVGGLILHRRWGTHRPERGPSLPPPREDFRPTDPTDPTEASRVRVRLGQRRQQPVMLDLAQARGVRLIGPGAAEVERALLVELVTAAQSGRGQVVTTRADLELLLGPRDSACADGLVGLTVCDNPAEVLELLGAAIIDRMRRADDTAQPDQPGTANGEAHTGASNAGLVCVLAPGGQVERLNAELQLGGDLGMGALLLGDWPHGTTLEVDEGGMVGSGTGPAAAQVIGTQTCGLGQDAARDQIAALNPPPGLPAPLAVGPGPSAAAGETDQVPGMVRLLGGYRLEGPAGPVTFRRTDAWALLALLVEHRGQLLTRAMIEDRLWPDERVSDAKFNTLLRDTRARLCEALGYPSGKGRLVIRNVSGNGYQLNRELFTCDVWQLRDHAARAVTATGPAKTTALRAAVARASGAYLPDHDQLWARHTGRELTRTVVEVLTELAAAETTPECAVLHLERACEIDPTAEHLYRQRMQHYATLGRPTAIHHCFEQLAGELAGIGATPEERTSQLYRRLTDDT